jgi:hypothetical protein
MRQKTGRPDGGGRPAAQSTAGAESEEGEMTETDRLTGLLERVRATFDPGATLPEDCEEWAHEHDAAIDALEAALVPSSLPAWFPSPRALAQHVALYRTLRETVAALDSAAADDQPYGGWAAAQWAVFNAAVTLVKETEGAAQS